MGYKQNALVILSLNILILWMVLKTFVTDSGFFGVVILVAVALAVLRFRIPPVDESSISKSIKDLFDMDDGENMKNHEIFHKAGASHAPENTLEAVKEAIKRGAPAIEIDLCFTKDGVGVAMHGPLLDDMTDGSGPVSIYTFEELQAFNAAAKFPDKKLFPVARIPTLEDCVEECVKNGVIIFFDCKSNTTQTAELITGLYCQHPVLYDLGIVCSFYPHIVYAVRQKDPKILTGLTWRHEILTSLGDGTPRNKEIWKQLVAPLMDKLLYYAHNYVFWFLLGNSFFLLNKDCVSLDSKSFWDKLGIRLVTWTVNDPLEKEFLVSRLGVPVITDGHNQSP